MATDCLPGEALNPARTQGLFCGQRMENFSPKVITYAPLTYAVARNVVSEARMKNLSLEVSAASTPMRAWWWVEFSLYFLVIFCKGSSPSGKPAVYVCHTLIHAFIFGSNGECNRDAMHMTWHPQETNRFDSRSSCDGEKFWVVFICSELECR